MSKMRRYNELILQDEKLQYSSRISCTWKVEAKELEIYLGRDAHNIPYATTNLQTDYSNFESIAFCVWAKYPECKIVLRYEPLKWYTREDKVFPLDYENYDACLEWIAEEKKKRDLNDSIRARMLHYMRFLYRVMKMKELYGKRFEVDTSNDSEVMLFTKEFSKGIKEKLFTITEPMRKGGVKGISKVSENHLEKWFAHCSATPVMEEKCPEFVRSCSGNIQLYDQFPCGLFVNSKSEKNRIFNSGAFDLWGLDTENNICLYELKEYRNAHLGIISELFFYSCLMSDFKKIAPDKGTEYRGFAKFIQANDKVRAYFLVPRFHAFVEKNLSGILQAMNGRGDDVQYDAIRFKQEDIVGDDVKAFIDEVNALV